MNCIKRFFSDMRYAISWGILGIFILSILLSIFVIFQTINISENDMNINSITVSGEAEIFAVPDIVSFSFSATKTEDNVSIAQDSVNNVINDTVNYLKENGIDDSDIKTTSYNANPQYEWIPSVNCLTEYCPSERKLVGYQVSQSVSVKVRDTEKVGTILSGVGAFNLDYISDLSFTIDDIESLEKQARDEAIENAKEDAKKLAKQLGVKLGDVISYYENIPYSGYGGYEMYESKAMMDSATPAVIPVGESQVTSQVSIVFEID